MGENLRDRLRVEGVLDGQSDTSSDCWSNLSWYSDLDNDPDTLTDEEDEQGTEGSNSNNDSENRDIEPEAEEV